MIKEWLWLNLRFFNWKLRGHGQLIYIDYPVMPQPRRDYGVRRLTALLAAHEATYADVLRGFAPYFERMQQFNHVDHSPSYAGSQYYPSGDAAALYGMVRSMQPRRIIEVGSGSSTHFARAAIHDGKLSTHITCIDPNPRREIETAADTIVRRPFETVDLSLCDQLEADDIFFFDGSHRSFPNSDVTTVFIDVLPRLKPGVIVHVHDIFLPDDYPAVWNDRFYNEQYLLACWLLAESPRVVPLLPMHYIGQVAALKSLLDEARIPGWGGAFWFRMG